MAKPKDVGFQLETTDVSIVTTTETVVATVSGLKLPFVTALLVIKAWVQLTTGASTTDVTVRIRRGSTIGGALVGEANPITIGAAAGSTEEFSIMVSEARANEDAAQYSVTVQQTAAAGNGTVVQAAIEATVL